MELKFMPKICRLSSCSCKVWRQDSSLKYLPHVPAPVFLTTMASRYFAFRVGVSDGNPPRFSLSRTRSLRQVTHGAEDNNSPGGYTHSKSNGIQDPASEFVLSFCSRCRAQESGPWRRIFQTRRTLTKPAACAVLAAVFLQPDPSATPADCTKGSCICWKQPPKSEVFISL